MSYVTAEARQELLDAVAVAINEIGVALAALGAAYELLDEHTADRLEDELFRPAQVAYGRAKRTHTGFADRYGLPRRDFEPASAGLPSQGIKGFLANAVESVAEADMTLAELQDSMMPVEVGDPEVRLQIAGVRELVSALPERARQLERVLGR
ncbi:MAG: hypothetical protein H0V22_10095 [Solirubrobacterales bacterium]|jgi:hypothetical protein|nr:hypothetical protein [Solirubrobacterales bacterium]